MPNREANSTMNGQMAQMKLLQELQDFVAKAMFSGSIFFLSMSRRVSTL
jgi:hypothetical protein